MEAVIPISRSKGGKDVVSARLLHSFLQVASNFTTWFARRVEEYSFQQAVDFIPVLEESTGGRQAQDFVITLDMAKELSMVERNEKGQIARRYFIECEKKLRGLVEAARPSLPSTYKEALAALLAEVEQKEKIEQQLALAAPKVAFFEAVAVSNNSLSFTEAAKWLKIAGVGRNKLIAMLRRDKVLMKNREPYQQHINAGYCGWQSAIKQGLDIFYPLYQFKLRELFDVSI
jgi:anti-repressor protein